MGGQASGCHAAELRPARAADDERAGGIERTAGTVAGHVGRHERQRTLVWARRIDIDDIFGWAGSVPALRNGRLLRRADAGGRSRLA